MTLNDTSDTVYSEQAVMISEEEDPVADSSTGGDGPTKERGFKLLDQEPKKLHAECQRLDSAINALSAANFKVYLNNFESLQNIREGCTTMSQQVEVVESQLPPLAETCSKFQLIGSRIEQEFQRNRQTYRHHNQLFELLELPHLLNVCIRQKLFTEAFNLCLFSDNLLKRHTAINVGLERWSSQQQEESTIQNEGKGLRVIEGIAMEVDRCVDIMREQLLLLLKQPISIPVCINYVGYIRQIDARASRRRGDGPGSDKTAAHGLPPDYRLRREFLECRENSSNADASRDKKGDRDPYRYLIEVIEKNRRRWLDLINLYTVVFGAGGDELLDDGAILASWVAAKVRKFVGLLRAQLDQVFECGCIARVMDQCLFLGSSLAKVGADCRPQLQGIFAQRVRVLMLEYWNPAAVQLHVALRQGRWGAPLPMPQVGEKGGLSPPLGCLGFPSVAEWVNVMVTSLNELKQCALAICVQDLAGDYQRCLEHVLDGLIGFAEEQELNDARKRQFGDLLHLIKMQVVPFMDRCICSVFHLDSADSFATVAHVPGLDNSKLTAAKLDGLLQKYPSAAATRISTAMGHEIDQGEDLLSAVQEGVEPSFDNAIQEEAIQPSEVAAQEGVEPSFDNAIQEEAIRPSEVAAQEGVEPSFDNAIQEEANPPSEVEDQVDLAEEDLEETGAW